jgi:adenosylcobinamide-GDP ribazoletransferase
MGLNHRLFIVPAIRFCTAMRFLTLIPISWHAEEDPHHFAECPVFFTAVGGVIGTIGALAAYILQCCFPQPVVAVLSLIYLAFISGCLHLDGLSDSADGLLSSRPREDCLKIMKDSRAGAMGIVVVVIVLLAKYGALSAMLPETLCLAVFFMPLAGRCAILLTMAGLPYARQEGGLGLLFYSDKSKKAAAIAMSVLIGCLAFFAPGHVLPVLAGLLVVLFLFNRWCKIKLGGATGDTLGAVCELSEMIVAVMLTATIPLI